MNKVKDLSGKKFGKLKVIRRDESAKAGRSKWICECDCGNIVSVYRNHLITGNTISCGCSRKGTNTRDITGQRFGRLLALERTSKKSGKVYIYKCQCDCGNICYVSGASLRRGAVVSCGCYAAEVHTKSVTAAQMERGRYLIDGTDILSLANKEAPKNNTSGCRGVSWHSSAHIWTAHINFKGVRYYLGSSADYNTVVAYRKEAERELYDNFLDWYAAKYPDRWEKIKKKSK